MVLTVEALQPFIGGQMEIANRPENYVYRGEIERVECKGPDLVVTFTWLAQMSISATDPTRWVVCGRNEYRVDRTLCGIPSNIGPGSDGGGNRIAIAVPVLGEMIVFYPPDGSKLDPNNVIGYGLRQAAVVE